MSTETERVYLPKSNVILKELRIQSFRNIKTTTLNFNSNYNLVLGKNAAGKTTLLKLITSVLGGGFEWCTGEEVAIEWVIGINDLEIEAKLKIVPSPPPTPDEKRTIRRKAGEGITWKICLSKVSTDGSKELQYTIDTDSDSLEMSCRDSTGKLSTIIRHSVLQRSQSLDEILFDLTFVSQEEGNRLDVQDGIETYAESVLYSRSRNRRFDESLLVFKSIFRNSSVEGTDSTYAKFYEFEEDLFSSRFERLPKRIGDKFYKQYKERPAHNHLSISFDPRNEGLFTPSDFGIAKVNLKSERRSIHEDDDYKVVSYANITGVFETVSGRYVTDDQLSYGQKRLIAFLFFIWSENGPIVADELVNGLHHSWIKHCVTTLKNRQCFLTSQNPLLFDHIPFESMKAVKDSFVICKVTDEGKLDWYNLQSESAQNVFKQYEVGISSMADILIEYEIW